MRVSVAGARLKGEGVFYCVEGPVMLGWLLLLQVFLLTTRGHFRKWQGVTFVACYAGFVIVQYVWFSGGVGGQG